MSLSSKSKTLELLYLRSKNCKVCSLHRTRTNFVFGEGNPDAKLVLIGEAPGFEEDQRGLPFVGRCGQLLTELLETRFKLFRANDYFITNIVHCRPYLNGKDRPPTQEEMASCSWITSQIIKYTQPEVIVAMGNTANTFLSGGGFYITKMHGKVYNYNGMKVIPTFHPSYLLRNKTEELINEFCNDISLALSSIKSIE